ncbi:MAG: FecR domain-containing protein [Rubrivivax sp.]|nr:FecR domain-containing protein [Rubrivivax sp.]
MRRAAPLLVTLLLVAAGACAQPAEVDEPVYVHVAVRGDTLIGLGRRFLVDPKRWPEVQRANQIRNPNRIPVGNEVRIPLRLMRTETATASVLGVVGEVRSAGRPLASGPGGLPVGEGSDISTGADGHATVRLVDGTLLRLRPGSRLTLRESRRVRDANAVQSGARLERGRVEIEAAPAAAGKPGFRIETPQGVLGVRGTEFRVATEGDSGVTRGEVLGGVVAFGGRGGAATPVSAGLGSVIGARGDVAPPVKLLPAPELKALPVLQERLLVRLALPALPGAAQYRAQVSLDTTFDKVLADLTTATPELRFADLPDADYVLRVRGIDALGLEGRDADHRFRLKARPEAPLPSAPAPRAVSFGSRVEFAWTGNAEAASYRMRVAATPDFTTPLRVLDGLRDTTTVLEGLPTGTWHWQLRSVRADGDAGPWGDARSFELRPLPPQPAPPKVGERGVSFAWEGRPGQTFEFQVARDAAFARMVLEKQLTEPKLDLPLPGTGRFWVRLRARDPDGFMGPYTTPQSFDAPNCLRDGSGNCVRGGADGQPLQLNFP